LNFTCKLDSNQLACSLEVANKSLIKDIQEHYNNPTVMPYPDEENPLLSELSDYLENAGINDPFTKIYITTGSVDNLALLIFLFVTTQTTKFQYNGHLATLIHKKDKRSYDGSPFVVGIITLLKQFHHQTTMKFLAYLGQYIRASINISLQSQTKLEELPEEAISSLLFLEDFCKFSKYDRKTIEAYVPPYIFDNFNH